MLASFIPSSKTRNTRAKVEIKEFDLFDLCKQQCSAKQLFTVVTQRYFEGHRHFILHQFVGLQVKRNPVHDQHQHCVVFPHYVAGGPGCYYENLGQQLLCCWLLLHSSDSQTSYPRQNYIFPIHQLVFILISNIKSEMQCLKIQIIIQYKYKPKSNLCLN